MEIIIGREKGEEMDSTVDDVQTIRILLEKEGFDPEQYFPSCVGCGYCCLQATCLLGVYFFGDRYPCSALFWNGEQYRCKLAEEYKGKLHIGSGCCFPLNEWRKEVRKR